MPAARLYRVLVFGTLSSSPVTSRLNVVFDLVPTAYAMLNGFQLN